MTLGQAIDRVRGNIIKLGLQREPICYNASEAVYLLTGGKQAGLKAMRIKRGNHWFLQCEHGEIVDLTAGQFTRYTYKKLPAYSQAKGASFFPATSTLAKQLMT